MQEANLYQLFTDKLNTNKISYAVTGSVASIIYGEPRMTHDIDIVIEINVNNVNNLANAFPAGKFYFPPIDVLKTEVLRKSRGHCNIIHNETGFKADIYFTGSDELQKWAITSAKYFDFNESKISVAPPEYVIIKKLQFYKEGNAQKHIEDIKSILFHSKELIDFSILEKYITKFGLKKEWKLTGQ
jgi:hypothetical protein